MIAALALGWLLLAQEIPARVFAGRGERADLPAALAALAHEPQAQRREQLATFLGRADLGAEALEARVRALGELALLDPAESVRSAAVSALADSWQPAAWECLDGLLDRGDAQLRPRVARALADRARSPGRIVARVLAGVRGAEDVRVLAPLLGAYGRALADLEHGGEQPGELAAFLAFERAGDPALASAARSARAELFRRLRARAEPERALALSRALEGLGEDADECARERLQTALAVGRDAHEALTAARELLGRALAAPEPGRAAAVGDARTFVALAQLALGEFDAARADSAELARTLDAALESAARERSLAGAVREAQLAGLRARAELVDLLARLAAGAGAEPDASVLDTAAALHRLALRWQLAALRARSSRPSSLDEFLTGGDSVLVLLCENPWRTQIGPCAALELERALGRTLRSVAPRELPGFEPWPSATGRPAPLADPERAKLLRSLLAEEAAAADQRMSERLAAALRGERGDPTGLAPALERELLQLDSARRSRIEDRAAAARGDEEVLYELRTPSGFAIDLARTLRDEGRSAEAAALATAAQQALESDPAAQRYLWGVELRAECEVLRGNAKSDLDDPAAAEVDLARALERLEALEGELEKRGVPHAALGRLRGIRSSVLVGLAVNANVKQHDPKKALAYFERGWELRQDDFMKALRACYLARAARGDEARALLREIVPAPGTLYNLACTWALLGEKQQALRYLEQDFAENLPTPGMRARQQDWAKSDPDLETLRGEPRFQALLAR
ncbi:MAG: hypothetical protein IPJ19_20620 [Planctomycetes bacterium]|nr:hypothetical protein [Planctomycetota bacterium]